VRGRGRVIRENRGGRKGGIIFDIQWQLMVRGGGKSRCTSFTLSPPMAAVTQASPEISVFGVGKAIIVGSFTRSIMVDRH
jgi:hypothetical protein